MANKKQVTELEVTESASVSNQFRKSSEVLLGQKTKSSTPPITELENDFKVSQKLQKKIIRTLEKKRFTDSRDFIERAIEVLLAWEDDPKTAIKVMNEVDPTMEQYALMQKMMNNDELQKMYHGKFPEQFGEKWNEFLKNNSEASDERQMGAIDAQEKERRSHGDLEKLIDSIKDSITFIQDKGFKNIKPKEGYKEIKSDAWPLLWNYYSRILPAKITIMVMADIMRKNNDTQILLDEENKEHIYDVIEKLSTKIREDEKRRGKEEKNLNRTNKISTGLPKPGNSNEKLSVGEMKTRYNTIARYKDRIIGKPRKDREFGDEYFDGLLSALGLIRIFREDKKIYITLTEEGKKFCLYENPVLNGDYKYAFSREESKFIITKLISQRTLEYKLMQTAVEVVKSYSGENESKAAPIVKSLDSRFKSAIEEYLRKEKDQIIVKNLSQTILSTTEKIENENSKLQPKDKKQTPIEAYRVAIMGRLSEMGVLNWTIENDASSSYKLADTEIVKELLPVDR